MSRPKDSAKAAHTPGPWTSGLNATEKETMIWSGAYPVAIVRDAHEKEANARLIAASPMLLIELKAAHQIILNALNIMDEDQKREWSDRNERDGVKDGWAVTREEARRSVIAKAEGSEK